jgi:3-deoxy-manno-octulosonate cytidylyltransferase (CMP-KDO synthetase)
VKGVLVVIPSRMGSTRFPGKVLAQLGGRSIVEWCWRAAKDADVGPVLVATESAEVAAAVKSFGGQAALTSAACQSGSDRVHEAAKKRAEQVIINLQGDQPLIRPETIRAVAQVLADNRKADIATAVMPLVEAARAADPNVVKAAMGKDGRCLYFSRSQIPFARAGKPPLYEHLGIYGYRRVALDRFVKLPPSELEKAESLEQLRALEDGMSIFAAVVKDVPVAIDTPEDLKRAESLLEKTS